MSTHISGEPTRVWRLTTTRLPDGRWEIRAESGDGFTLSARDPDAGQAYMLLRHDMRLLDSMGGAP